MDYNISYRLPILNIIINKSFYIYRSLYIIHFLYSARNIANSVKPTFLKFHAFSAKRGSPFSAQLLKNYDCIVEQRNLTLCSIKTVKWRQFISSSGIEPTTITFTVKRRFLRHDGLNKYTYICFIYNSTSKCIKVECKNYISSKRKVPLGVPVLLETR